jgi:hypothetical protein
MRHETTIRHGQLGILGIFILLTALQILFLLFTVPDVRTRIASIEICTLVVSPLILFYLRNNWPKRTFIISIVSIVIVWFFTLPFFHELSHIIGLFAIGSKPIAYQLIPKFREGDFTTAWVRSETVNDWRNPIPGLFPYIKDIFLLILGFIILKGRKVGNAFWAGFIYAFFCLGSMFDIVNNFSQKLLGYVTGNDFYGVTLGWGDAWSNIIGITFSCFAVCMSIWVLFAYTSSNSTRIYLMWENGG